MKLIDLVPYLLNPELLEQLYRERQLTPRSEAPLVYMRQTLALDSDVFLFTSEETNDDIVFEKNGTQYIALFALDYAADLVEFDLQLADKGYADTEIAQRLLDYAINDA